MKRAQDIVNNLTPKRELLVNIEEQIKHMLLAKYESENAAIVSILVFKCSFKPYFIVLCAVGVLRGSAENFGQVEIWT